MIYDQYFNKSSFYVIDTTKLISAKQGDIKEALKQKDAKLLEKRQEELSKTLIRANKYIQLYAKNIGVDIFEKRALTTSNNIIDITPTIIKKLKEDGLL
jgi:Skp family chaperone for outer membrane proteins